MVSCGPHICGPYRVTIKGIWRWVAGRACPAPKRGVDGEMRDGGKVRRGGHPALRMNLKWGCRAASPLAAVEACGGGKLPGRDESLPYEWSVKGIWR